LPIPLFTSSPYLLEPKQDPISFEGSGPNKNRQEASHPHQIIFHRDELLVPDLGADKTWRLKEEDGRWNVVGSLDHGTGKGPRHAVIHSTLPSVDEIIVPSIKRDRYQTTCYIRRLSWLTRLMHIHCPHCHKSLLSYRSFPLYHQDHPRPQICISVSARLISYFYYLNLYALAVSGNRTQPPYSDASPPTAICHESERAPP